MTSISFFMFSLPSFFSIFFFSFFLLYLSRKRLAVELQNTIEHGQLLASFICESYASRKCICKLGGCIDPRNGFAG